MKIFSQMKSWLIVTMLVFLTSMAFAQGKSISGTISSASDYGAGAASDVVFNITYSSPDTEFLQMVTLTFPANVVINDAGTLYGEDGVVNGQVVTYGVPFTDNWDYLNGSSGNANWTVNLTAPSMGDILVAYVADGDTWGALPHMFTGNASISEGMPHLALNPGDLDLGEWPVGGWEAPVSIQVVNDGVVGAQFKSSDLDDPDNAFDFSNATLPISLDPTEYAEVDFSFNGSTAGSFEATYVAGWGSGVVTGRITAEGYMPATGDIFENPFVVASLPYNNNVVVANIKDNYSIQGVNKAVGAKDAVYAFTLTSDQEVTIASTNATVEFFIYNDDFDGEDGPMMSNVLANGFPGTSFLLFAGDYVLVAKANTDFDVTISATAMPVPVIAFNPDPADLETGINPASVTLTWETDDYADMYQVYFGTEYPPSNNPDNLLVDWSPLQTSITVGQLDNNTQYFWQVNLMNTTGVATGDNWGFTTKISIPANLVAAVADTNDVTLTWNTLGKSFQHYNVYRDGIMINAAPVTNNSFVDMDLAFNMTTGYNYTVTAVYDEGESDPSTAVNVKINGAGFVEGDVTELLNPGEPIANALVTLTSNSPTGETYEFITDATGHYEGAVYQDTYDYTVDAQDFSSESLDNVVVAYNATVVRDFELDEYPYGPTSVIAVIQANEQDVIVSWTMASKEILSFNLYRADCDGSNLEFLGNVLNGSQFIDNNWGGLNWGEYKYGVEVVYTNANSDIVFSTCLDKDMEVVVDVAVTTNSDDSPAGCFVSFTNTADNSFVYETLLTETGLASFPNFRRGNYDITVTLDKFIPISLNADILDDQLFEWELIEIIESPSLLYVTPVGYATWLDPNAVEDVTYMDETFASGIPSSWTIVDGGETTDTWYWEPLWSSFSGYLIVDSDWAGSVDMDEIIESPAMDASGAFELTLEFDQYFNAYTFNSYNEIGDVDVWDGTQWVNVLRQQSDIGATLAPNHQTIDVSAYANADFKVRFHYYDANYDFYWLVDNVKVSGRAVAGAKSFLSYRVWNDGIFATDTEVARYQYGSNDDLIYVPGQTYFAEVANEYSTGFSPRINYTWTYQPCESFPGNENMVAYYIDGTTSNQVEWDALPATVTIGAITYDVMGTNILRDGVEIAYVALADGNFFTDTNMDPGSYTYCTEVVYTMDGGAHSWTSCSNNCVADVVVPEEIFGEVSGTVTDAITGNAIAGAVVIIANDDNSTQFITDENGAYAGNVVIGTYTYTVSALGYITETLADVAIAYGSPVVLPFQLEEFPYPTSNVHATEISDDQVLVTWGLQPVNGWLTFHDGGDVTNEFGSASDYSIEYMNKFTAEDLTGLDFCSITSVRVYKSADYIANTYMVRISAGEDYTELYSEDITSQLVDGWNTITLNTAVPFDNDEVLWVSVYAEAAGAQYVSPMTDAIAGATNGDWFSFNNGTPAQIAGLGYPGLAWMLEAYATNGLGKSVAIGEYPKTITKDYSGVTGTLTSVVNENAKNNIRTERTDAEKFMLSRQQNANKALLGYNVYRSACTNTDPNNFQFLGYTLDDSFNDNNWGTTDWGMYKWVVEVVYTNSVSEPAFSEECLDKDMETVVNLVVTTNSGDSPGGAQVLFESVVETLEPLAVTMPGSGLKTVDPFRRGTYDVTVSKTGFATIELTNVVIHDTTTLTFELIEDLAAPSDLYVTPMGYATWSGAAVAPFQPFETTFEDASSFDAWELVSSGSTVAPWHFTTDYNGNDLDGTPFAFVDSDAPGFGTSIDESLISPVIDASMVSALFVEFDQYYNFYTSGEFADVDVYNGSEWVTVLHQVADAGVWGSPAHASIDVTEHANADFRVRFHYAAAWGFYWAVDNVKVIEASGKSTDAIMDYLVYHDDTYSGSTVIENYQYGVNEVLVAGETYFAEVATVYATGTSARANYTWTYMPCDSFPNAAGLAAANVAGSDDVLVQWGAGFEPPMELVTINQGYGEASNGYFQSWDYGYGVAYDFTQYPDALVNSVNFRHSSWGTPGTWEYMIHIIDWDTRTILASVGPFETTGDDTWENNVLLGDVATNGASEVAILMEPMGNDAADAYPCLDSDDAANPQGSVYGDLSDLNGIGASTIGNFLVDVTIYTAVTAQPFAPVVMNTVEAPAAKARVASSNVFNPNPVVMQQVAKSSKSSIAVLGTNVYRDGSLLGFVPAPDTFYLDMDLAVGYYDYCVAAVYSEDQGLHTWESCDVLCVEDVLVPEQCIAPENLTAEDLLGDGYTASLHWGSSFEPVWLQYDDGVNVDGIGGPAEFSVAALWNPSQLVGFDGTAVTQVKFFANDAGAGSSFTLKIWKGTNGATLIHEQPLSGVIFGDWNTITLTTPVAIDVTQDLYIGYYVVSTGFPAGCGDFTGNSNSDLVSLDGAAWEHLSDYSLPYSWNLAAYVEGAKGAVIELPALVDHATYSNNGTLAVGNAEVSPNAVDPDFGSKELMGYNVYRDGVQVNDELVLDNEYKDVIGFAGYFCYTVTAVYEFCGESGPSNEACVDIAIGVNNLENSISVYPNPATDFVSVEASSNIRSIVITNYMGQVVSTVKSVELTKTTINTSDLSAGVYFVEVETAAGIEKVRIVISE